MSVFSIGIRNMSNKYMSKLSKLKKFIEKTANRTQLLHKGREEILAEKRKELMAKGLPKRKPIEGVKDIILVSSGKGGVGKSTVSVNLAVSLKNKWATKEVGLLDADIFGPCIPLMMNAQDKPFTNSDAKMLPLRNWGIKCLSMGQFIENDKAVVWRGLMVMQALETLLRKVEWGNLDYLIIDTPPGTGDTHLSLIQNIPISAVVMVTTPQKPSLQVTARSIAMFKKMKVNIAGVVENMSHIICPHCGHDASPYSNNETKEFCKEHDLQILGSIPLETDIATSSDIGKPIVVSKPDSLASHKFHLIADRVVEQLKNLSEKTTKIEDQTSCTT